MARYNDTDRRFDDDAASSSQRDRGDGGARLGRRDDFSEEGGREDERRASGGQRGRRDLVEAGYTRQNTRGDDEDYEDFSAGDTWRDDDAAWRGGYGASRRREGEPGWNERGRGSNVGYRGDQRGRAGSDRDGEQRGERGFDRRGRNQASQADQDSEFDPDYTRWRDEQMRSLDEDYRAFRTERAKSFASDFEDFRKTREGANKQSGGSRKGSTQTGSESQH